MIGQFRSGVKVTKRVETSLFKRFVVIHTFEYATLCDSLQALFAAWAVAAPLLRATEIHQDTDPPPINGTRLQPWRSTRPSLPNPKA